MKNILEKIIKEKKVIIERYKNSFNLENLKNKISNYNNYYNF